MPLYRYTWGNNKKSRSLKGRSCRIVKKGSLNTVRVKFLDNGQEEIVFRGSLKKISMNIVGINRGAINRFRLERGFSTCSP